ncbi:hypothetical protein ACIHJG_21885 [Streptomyces sp. NPDC052415]|uniref:hypothetical protein n=1 Tax=Streptomyces sp. NPDC052415 TaxID=3365690 RepID=UPI0037CCE2D3
MELEAASVVIGALAAGGAQGLQDTASAAVQDAYARLRGLVVGRFHRAPYAEDLIDDCIEDPETGRAPLEAALQESGALNDPAVVEAAHHLITLLDPPSAVRSQYSISIVNSSGLQVNHEGSNTQVNTFNR